MTQPQQEKLLFPFIAPPAGGKGTQTKALAAKFNLPKVDMGSILRQRIQTDPEMAETISKYQKAGELVPIEIVMTVLKDGLKDLLKANPTVKGIIMDGFPRSLEQAEKLLEIGKEIGARVGKAFYLDVPNEVLIERAKNRWICENEKTCGEIYSTSFKPPKQEGVCDKDGGKLIKRPEDDEKTVQDRLVVYENETKPVIDKFKAEGLLYRVDGNQSADKISQEIASVVEPLLNGIPAGSAH